MSGSLQSGDSLDWEDGCMGIRPVREEVVEDDGEDVKEMGEEDGTEVEVEVEELAGEEPGKIEGGRIGVDGQERRVKALGDPRRPTKKEVEEHEKTHVPYRSRCEHCVRGRGRDLDHRADAGEERRLSEYGFDYCFPGDEFGHKLTILCGRERNTGMIMGAAVPHKGSKGKYGGHKAVELMEECGDKCNKVVLKSDPEPAMNYLKDDIVAERREGQTVVEDAPKGSTGSNGIAERAVQEIEGVVRGMKSALEARLGRKVGVREPLINFMPEYSSYLINILEVGKDGKTAYERNKGKRATVFGVGVWGKGVV